jgi:hypothetical protein
MKSQRDNYLDTRLDAVLNLLSQPHPKPKKNEIFSRLTKVMMRIHHAKELRMIENAKAGRDDGEDDVVAELDAAEDILLTLGAMPPIM